MMEEARQANESGWSKHRTALPLYDADDAERATRLFRPIDFEAVRSIAHGADLEFGRAGHILGSAWAHLTLGDHSVVVSGDLGRPAHRVLLPPQPRPVCDALLIESTYGD